jgi:type I restriction enzyme M protein
MKQDTKYTPSLFPSSDHKEAFKRIRNFLAGRFVGATRDRALLDEVLKCVFCKNYIQSHISEFVISDDPLTLSKQYREVFSKLKQQLTFVFSNTDEIQLDPLSIHFVDQELKNIDLLDTQRDVFGDLFEVFVGTGIREEEGQFFTPKNGVELLISMIDPKPGEKIIDPAAGAGGFLSSAYNYLSKKSLTAKKINASLFGIEKDCYLARLTATRLAIRTLQEANVVCGDSLAWVDQDNKPLDLKGTFDIVLTNPPFGKNIVSTTKEIQKTFDLGFDWKFDQTSNRYIKNGKLLNNVSPQVLFIEKCISLLKEGGRLGVVVPESLITSKSYSHVVQYMRDNGRLISVIGMPEDFFKTSGKGGTHTKACLVVFVKDTSTKKRNGTLFMAEAKWCGHDSRGRKIANDDLPLIYQNYQHFVQEKKFTLNHLGYTVPMKDLEENILSPRYYNPDVKNALFSIEKTHEILKFGDLVDQGVIEVKTGNEVGKLAYGTGSIPFVRTSDISNWEIKLDPKHGVSNDIYEQLARKQDVRENDILMVKDGTYLIGTCALVSKYDTRIVYQSHLYKFRVLKKDKISPYLLLAVLSSEPVQKQIKSKRFTQDIIDSLGARVYELLLPIPKSKTLKKRIETNVKKAIDDRVEARELARIACSEVVGDLVD